MNPTYIKEQFIQNLLIWYERNKRELAFRKDKNPYRIWISEIMAQQTRIETMIPYFERFIQKYPDVKSLSQADDDELMAMWQGLGYYSRARSLKKAAIMIMEEYDGVFPLKKEELKKLPGIGDYTAGAIASIAGRQKASAIDGNVIRVFSRLFEFGEDPGKASGKKQMTALVEAFLPEADLCGDFNQALMEIGALVCLPKSPSCSFCPLEKFCLSRKSGKQLEYPMKSIKKPRTIANREIWVIARESMENKKDHSHVSRASYDIKIQKRSEKGLLSGLFEFGEQKPQGKEYRVFDLGSYIHIFSHKEWHMNAKLAVISYEDSERLCQQTDSLQKKPDHAQFVPMDDIASVYALPTAFMPFFNRVRKILNDQANMNQSDSMTIQTIGLENEKDEFK